MNTAWTMNTGLIVTYISRWTTPAMLHEQHPEATCEIADYLQSESLTTSRPHGQRAPCTGTLAHKLQTVTIERLLAKSDLEVGPDTRAGRTVRFGCTRPGRQTVRPRGGRVGPEFSFSDTPAHRVKTSI
jgi:hypothetical protein